MTHLIGSTAMFRVAYAIYIACADSFAQGHFKTHTTTGKGGRGRQETQTEGLHIKLDLD